MKDSLPQWLNDWLKVGKFKILDISNKDLDKFKQLKDNKNEIENRSNKKD